MSDSIPRAVYDCMVYLQAAMSVRGPAARCLDAAEAGHVRVFVSESVLSEIVDVLGRPALQRRRSHLTPAFIAAFAEKVRRTTTVLEPVPRSFCYVRDPEDEPYLNLAIAAEAAYLVSRDRDLLDLQQPGSAAGRDLRLLCPELTILEPEALLLVLSPGPESATQ